MNRFAPLHPYLKTQLSAGRLSHAYLFTGTGGMDQALSLAAALCCQEPLDDGSACGSCQACVNIAGGVYPDLRIFDTEITHRQVERVRELVGLAAQTAMNGGRKIFIFPQAERLNDDSSNTLLKLLEEPDQDTVLILLSQSPDAILPTVLSRCQLFSFGADAESAEPVLPEGMLDKAVSMLRSLPDMPLYQVLLLAREYDGDRENQRLFFFALLRALHLACRGELALPMEGAQLLRSAAMCESAVSMLGPASLGNVGAPVARNVNQKMLTDVVYLRLWQNTSR